jgi:hypothetical protein
MEQIRRHYAKLAPEASQFFTGPATNDSPLATLAVRRGRRSGLFTIASMIAVVNSVVGGTMITLLVAYLRGGFSQGFVLPITIGVLIGSALIAAFLMYQDIRYKALAP